MNVKREGNKDEHYSRERKNQKHTRNDRMTEEMGNRRSSKTKKAVHSYSPSSPRESKVGTSSTGSPREKRQSSIHRISPRFPQVFNPVERFLCDGHST